MTSTPDFFVRHEGAFINNAGRDFLVRYSEMVAQKRQLDACEVGVAIAQIFVKHPWVQSFGLQLDATVAYDRGAREHTNECCIEILEPVAAPGATIPLEIMTSSEFDEFKAEKVIRQELLEDKLVLHETLLGLNQESSERFYFDRDKLLGLAGPDGAIKGSSAFAALFAGTPSAHLISAEWISPPPSTPDVQTSVVTRPRMR